MTYRFKVSVAFLDLALMDNFYMYAYALPVWNLGMSPSHHRSHIELMIKWTHRKV